MEGGEEMSKWDIKKWTKFNDIFYARSMFLGMSEILDAITKELKCTTGELELVRFAGDAPMEVWARLGASSLESKKIYGGWGQCLVARYFKSDDIWIQHQMSLKPGGISFIFWRNESLNVIRAMFNI